MTKWRTLPDGSWSLDRTCTPVAVYQPLWLDHVIRPSQALTRIRMRCSTPRGGELGASETVLASSFDERSFQLWRTNLRLFRECARIFDAKLFVAKQATLIVPDLPDSERSRCKYHYHGFDHDAHVRAFDGMYGVIDEEVADESIIDCTELSGASRYFYDHIHLTPEGTTAIAAIVAGHIERYVTRLPITD